MRIGQLAGTTGVSPDTIRYYEKIGLMPPPKRTEAGYRDYLPGAIQRLRVIRTAVQLGFPLTEIAKVLSVRDAGGAPCRQVRNYAQHLAAQMAGRIEALTAERQAMLSMIGDWDARLAEAPPGMRAHLLERVTLPPVAPTSRATRLGRRR